MEGGINEGSYFSCSTIDLLCGSLMTSEELEDVF